MNRTEFMRELESLLQGIPEADREKALKYYNEYFNDAGPENEQNVIEALGNPARVAERIRRESGVENTALITRPADFRAEDGNGEQGTRQSDTVQTMPSEKKEGMSTGLVVLIVVLCVLASPIILGVASAGIGVAAGLIAGWLGLIIGFGVTAVAMLLVLIALVVTGIIALFSYPFVGMGLIGAGLICGGVGLLFLMLTVAMAGIATPAICQWIGGLFQKRGKANA